MKYVAYKGSIYRVSDREYTRMLTDIMLARYRIGMFSITKYGKPLGDVVSMDSILAQPENEKPI